MILYLRCVWHNNAALLGYLFTVGPLLYFVLSISEIILVNFAQILFMVVVFVVGVLSLYFSDFGLETLRAYQRTRHHIHANKGTFNFRFTNKVSAVYCSKVGAELAIKDYVQGSSLD